MTILDIGLLSPAIGAAKLRTPVTLAGDFTLWLDYSQDLSQDLSQGEWLYAFGSDADPNAVFSVNAGEVWLSGNGASIGVSNPNPGSGRHTLRFRRVGAESFIAFDGLPEQPATVAGDGAASFTFDKINSAIDQPHSDPGSVIHSLRIETPDPL